MENESFQIPAPVPNEGQEKVLALANMAEWKLCLENNRIWIGDDFIGRLFPNIEDKELDIDRFLSRVDKMHRDTITRRLMDKDLSSEKPFDLEFRFNRADGEIFYFRLFGAHRWDLSGNVVERYGLIQDITSRCKTEQTLEEKEREKNLVIDTIPVGLAIWTPERRLIWANRQIFEMYDVEYSEKASNELCYRLLKPGDDICRSCPVLEALHRKQSLSREIKLTSKSLYVSVFPYLDKYGECIRIITMVYDVSDMRKRQQHMLDEKKMEAVRSLSAGLVQDFNNLLQAIYLWVGLSKESSDKSSHVYQDKIIEAIHRGYDLTNQMRLFSGQDKNFHPQTVEVGEFLNHFVTRLRQSICNTITVTVRTDESLPPIHADAKSLENMLNILTTNAVEAMEKGGNLDISAGEITLSEQIDIRGRLSKGGRYVQIAVKDTGVGIDEMELSRIFNPFFTTKFDHENRGMSLPLVYAEMRRHKGHVQAASNKGKGTTISLYFPVSNEPEQDTPDMFSTIQKDGRVPPVTVLLVEDDLTVRTFSTRLLEKQGFKVIEAADGETAIELFSQQSDSIDLVLLDVILPRRSGREVYEVIKRMKPNARVIFATGYSADYLEDIPDDAVVIQKPFSKEALLNAIKGMLKGISENDKLG
ncbi:MAG: ATP-binding protein [bacterium]